MTKEECVALLCRYAEYDGMGIPNLAGCREAMKMAADLLSQPYLPDNLDEAAEEWCKRNNKGIALCGDKKSHYLTEGVDAFKAGAEWMAKQGVKARCIESCNPVSSNKDERLHLITLLYTENENTPYVVGGDTIELIIQKKQ